MPTLSLTVLPAKALKDGRNKVRIAVAHNSQTRYIVTDVIIDSPKEWKNGQVVKRGNAAYLNSKLRNKINEVQLAIDNIPYPEILTCAEVIEEVARARAHASCTIGAAFEEMMSVSTSKPSSVAMYRSQFSSISRFIRPGMHVRTISKMTIMTYIKQRSGLSQATIQDHVALLARILRFCQENGYTDFKENPAKGCIRFTTVIRNSWLTPDEVRKVRDAEFVSVQAQRFKDLFMLSYYLGGINAKDLVKIDFRDAKTVKYVRTKTDRTNKTNPFVEFDIPDEAIPIINKYMGKDGTIQNIFTRGYISNDVSRMGITAREEIGLPQMTYYSARKSFAQHAFQLGVSESVIDYILGHALNNGRKSTIYSYIKVTPAMATAAIRKVIDFINGTENFD